MHVAIFTRRANIEDSAAAPQLSDPGTGSYVGTDRPPPSDRRSARCSVRRWLSTSVWPTARRSSLASRRSRSPHTTPGRVDASSPVQAAVLHALQDHSNLLELLKSHTHAGRHSSSRIRGLCGYACDTDRSDSFDFSLGVRREAVAPAPPGTSDVREPPCGSTRGGLGARGPAGPTCSGSGQHPGSCLPSSTRSGVGGVARARGAVWHRRTRAGR